MKTARLLFIIAAVAALLVPLTLSSKKVEVEPSYAWTLKQPLGLPEPAEIDTALVDYYLQAVAADVSEAWATTGNYGAPGRNMIFFDRKPASDFFFRDAIAHWIPTQGNHKFYNTRIPMTLLSYNTAGGRDNAQDRLKAIFSGNVNRSLQIGAMLDYIYSKGNYENQAMKNMMWGLSGSYMSDRYDIQAFFNQYNSVNKENGGITDDLYITNPAELQGGSASISPKNIPTRLTDAHSRVAGKELFLNGRYKLGFYERLANDSGVPDSVVRRRFVPVVSFVWTFDYNAGRHVFDNGNRSQGAEFWNDTFYLNPDRTHDQTKYHSVRNTVGVALLEGFNKYAKAGLSAFLTHEYLKYTQTADTFAVAGPDRPESLTPYPLDQRLAHDYGENRLYVGAQLTKQQGSWVRYEATGRLGLIGPTAGDIDIDGAASLRVPFLRDTLAVTAYGHFSNAEVPYLLKNYVSNHFIWQNDFGKTRSLRIGGRLDFPKTRTHLDVGVENVQNLVYFDESGMPRQHGSSVQVFSARLTQNFRVGILNWQNRLTYQTTTDDAVIPMPRFAVYSNLFILFKVAKVLDVQLGVDCDYYTSYHAPGYQPATMSFVNQREAKCGNYAFMNAYANMRLSRARFFVMFSHVNQGLFGNNYFSMPHYPVNPRFFQMGVSVDFAN